MTVGAVINSVAELVACYVGDLGPDAIATESVRVLRSVIVYDPRAENTSFRPVIATSSVEHTV